MARLPNAAAAPRNQLGEAQVSTPRFVVPNDTISGRKLRKPEHTWQLRARPWDLQPFMIAPVLAGETLKNVRWQQRAVSDPVKNKLTGWWKQNWFFYVAVDQLGVTPTDQTDQDLPAVAQEMVDMMVKGTALSTTLSTTQRIHNYKMGTMSCADFVGECMAPIVDHYFRDPEEGRTGYGGLGVRNSSLFKQRITDRLKWMDSLKIEDVVPTADSDLPGQYAQQPSWLTSEWATHYAQWQQMRDSGFTQVSFEDYLATFGIKADAGVQEYPFKPELIRYTSDFQYPSNTVDPLTGVPTSALSWSIAERGDKSHFFQKPGFIVGVTCSRPKVYSATQRYTAAIMLADAFGWLPATMRDDPYSSLIEYDHDEGPIAGALNSADDYWVDRRDLFLYGDQFLNFDPAPAGVLDQTGALLPNPGAVAGGTDNIVNKYYAADADIINMFVDDDDSSGLTMVREDGICTLEILGKQGDWT